MNAAGRFLGFGKEPIEASKPHDPVRHVTYVDMSKDPWSQDTTPRTLVPPLPSNERPASPIQLQEMKSPMIEIREQRYTPQTLQMFSPQPENPIGHVNFAPHNDRQQRPPSLLHGISREELASKMGPGEPRESQQRYIPRECPLWRTPLSLQKL